MKKELALELFDDFGFKEPNSKMVAQMEKLLAARAASQETGSLADEPNDKNE